MTQGLELRGAVLGKGYRLGRRLDTDDAATYEATHERIPGRFIIRLFPPETLSHPESASRIQRGARVASLLRDPHAVQVLDCNVSGETPAFVVSERVTGRSLTEVMADDGMLSLPRVVELVESLAPALAAGHRIGLVHGDIRPAHVILPTSGSPPAKLSGFGWAKELRAAARTPAASGYLAPEQDHGNVLTLDVRVDQFGLAAVTYEMIAACLPFSEESADLTSGSGTTHAPPAIADLVPGVPRALDDVLRRALAPVPSERFADVMEFATRLRTAALSPVGRVPDHGHPERSTSGAGATAGVGITPPRAKDDVPEELDFVALSSMRVGADPIEVGETSDNSSEGQGEGETESEAIDMDNDENEDAMLVLGGPSVAMTTTTTDNARTQIVRSPFLETSQPSDPSPPTPTGPTTPLRGLPIGRPPVGAGAREARAGGLPIGSGSVRGPGGRSQASPSGPEDPSLIAWFGTWQQRKWVFPALTAAGLLVIVATIIRLSGGSGHDRAAEDARKLVATVPTTPMPRPTAVPVAPVSPSDPNVAGAGGAAAAQPLPSLAQPTTGSAPAAPAPASVAANDGAAPGPIAGSTEPMPPTTSQPAPTAESQDALAARLRGNRPSRRQPPKTPVPAVTQPGKPAPVVVGPRDCSIRISSKPWAEIWIDGKNTGRKTPVDNLKVACGTRKLELKRPDQDIEQMEMLNVLPGKPYRGNYELE